MCLSTCLTQADDGQYRGFDWKRLPYIRDLITPDVLNMQQCSWYTDKSELHDIVATCVVHVHKDYSMDIIDS